MPDKECSFKFFSIFYLLVFIIELVKLKNTDFYIRTIISFDIVIIIKTIFSFSLDTLLVLSSSSSSIKPFVKPLVTHNPYTDVTSTSQEMLELNSGTGCPQDNIKYNIN